MWLQDYLCIRGRPGGSVLGGWFCSEMCGSGNRAGISDARLPPCHGNTLSFSELRGRAVPWRPPARCVWLPQKTRLRMCLGEPSLYREGNWAQKGRGLPTVTLSQWQSWAWDPGLMTQRMAMPAHIQ